MFSQCRLPSIEDRYLPLLDEDGFEEILPDNKLEDGNFMGVGLDNTELIRSKKEEIAFREGYIRIYTDPKTIKGYSILVDSFRVRTKKYSAYFMSHFHGDHYEGIDSDWTLGPIYGTKTTVMLLELKFGIAKQYLRALDYNVKTEVKELPGLYVTAYNANHCAGSAMFYFETKEGETHLFTGDFRYDKNSSICNKWIDDLEKKVDYLHLDMSFSVNSGRGHMKQLNPISEIFHELKCFIKDGLSSKALSSFPEPISPCSAKTLKDLNINPNKALFVVTTCVPGRERLIGILAQLLGLKEVSVVFGWRHKALQEGLKEYGHKNITVSEYNPFLDVVPSSRLLVLPSKRLDVANQMHKLLLTSDSNPFDCVVHIKSTGWDHQEPLKIISASPIGCPKYAHISISYTEHSDLTETQEFIKDLKPLHLRCPSVESASEEKQIIKAYLLGSLPKRRISRENNGNVKKVPGVVQGQQ